MTVQYRTLTEEAMADGAISVEEILALRKEGWSDGKIDADEAEVIFEQNDDLQDSTPEWTDYFVEAICAYLIANSVPRGYVNQQQADWLIAKIDRESGVESMGELELLATLFEKAESVPESLKKYAVAQIEQVVASGAGPTRDGGTLNPNTITTSECHLLRRFIFAAGGDRPAGVSRAEADLLFRIKDATLGKDNAAEWKRLFVQGVGHYLQGFSGHEQLSQSRAAELEGFMNDSAVNIGRFFSRMATTRPADAAKGLRHDESDYLDFDEAAAADAAVTSAEQQWLQSRINADHQLDELEQALLDFIAEEA
jgi:hypothetical protein